MSNNNIAPNKFIITVKPEHNHEFIKIDIDEIKVCSLCGIKIRYVCLDVIGSGLNWYYNLWDTLATQAKEEDLTCGYRIAKEIIE